MAHRIIIDSGEILNFKLSTSVSYYFDQILISDTLTDFAFFLNHDLSLKSQDASLLIENKMGYLEGGSIFDLPDLSSAIFNWNSEPEIEFIKSFIKSKSTALDCGCGYGRILYPLAVAGLKVDGVDMCYSAILYLKQKIGSIKLGLFCCSIDNFINPDFYQFVFSTLNTLRYLQNIHSIKRHFKCVAQSLKKGGFYLFNVSITEDYKIGYNISWNFLYLNESYKISWTKTDYNLLSNTMTDFVQITNTQTDSIYLSEEQIQFMFTRSILTEILESISDLFILRNIYDQDFSSLGIGYVAIKGNFWFQLEKK